MESSKPNRRESDEKLKKVFVDSPLLGCSLHGRPQPISCPEASPSLSVRRPDMTSIAPNLLFGLPASSVLSPPLLWTRPNRLGLELLASSLQGVTDTGCSFSVLPPDPVHPGLSNIYSLLPSTRPSVFSWTPASRNQQRQYLYLLPHSCLTFLHPSQHAWGH